MSDFLPVISLLPELTLKLVASGILWVPLISPADEVPLDLDTAFVNARVPVVRKILDCKQKLEPFVNVYRMVLMLYSPYSWRLVSVSID